MVALLAWTPVSGALAENSTDAAGVVKELRQLQEKIDEASFHSNVSTTILFVVGLAVAAVAAFGTYQSLTHLKKQSKYFERHLEHLREDVRIKTWPVLSWIALEGKTTHTLVMRGDGSRLITIRVSNVGTASALNVKSWETCGVSSRGHSAPAEKRFEHSWGSLPPGGFIDISVPVSAEEHARSASGEFGFVARIKVGYASVYGRGDAYEVGVEYRGGRVSVHGPVSTPN